MGQRSDDDLAVAWHDLMGRYHRITCVLDRELSAKHELTLSEFEVLQLLHDAAADPTGGRCGSSDPDGKVRLHELGDQVHLTQSALSRLVSRLEQDGLVERAVCTDDRRSVWAQITPAGVARYSAAKPTQRAVLREQAVGCLDQSEYAFAAARS